MKANDEVRRTNVERNPNERTHFRFGVSDFGFPWSFVIRHSLLLGSLLVLSVAGLACRRDMFNQPSSKPLERSDFFQDNSMASRPLVPHTVARGHLDEDEAFYAGKIGTNLVETFPLPITRQVLQRGRERYDIYCA